MKIQFAAIIVAAGCASSAMAQAINPWGVSIFTGANLGKSSERFQGSATGPVYSRGQVYSNNFNVGAGLIGNSDVVYSGILTGGIRARGTLTLNSGNVSGGVVAGGNLTASSGNTVVNGGAVLSGTNQAGNRVTINGGLTTNASFVSNTDFAAMEQMYRSASGLASSLSPNSIAILSGNTLTLTGSGAGTNVFAVSAAQLEAAQNVIVNGVSGSTAVLNVAGDSVRISTVNWNYLGGASAATTLIHAATAFSVTASGTVGATLLAPDALVRLQNTHVHGSVFSLGLVGTGNLDGRFTGVVPAPGAAALLVASGLMAIRRRR